MTLTQWLPLAVVCSLGAVSPGPSLAMVLRHTLKGGASRGMMAAVSHALGVGAYALLTVAGIGWLFEQWPMLYQGVSLLGACYLAWVGVQALSAARQPSATDATAVPATVDPSPWKDGICIALANPKLIVFFLALLSQFVDPTSTTSDRATIVLTALIIDGLWYVMVALVLSRPRPLGWLRQRESMIERLTGWVLLALAAGVFLDTFMMVGPL
ncbi:LysE family translocator [Larsenimonas rhizosphaerae]|uniref:LysE family translocator n=1 Tax=Larsenimonas rhizosphaerae TaxID=2944682 RepID=A0AA41ZGZ1_9GAMM|nr:LysE family translocator [Larsenimonas rhizosphaerae]MCX2524577.1 LysE family translocator [Larsenimonas rhizosphaerae]